VLTVRTIGLRRKLKIGVGDKDNLEMLRAIRVHANFAEYVPLTLLLIFLVENLNINALFVHALGALLLLGRCIHAYGMSQVKENFLFRVTGMAMTLSVILISSATLLFRAMAT
jgi:hypothetical protein